MQTTISPEMQTKINALVTESESAGKVVLKVAGTGTNFGKGVSHAKGVLRAKFDGETKLWVVPAGYAQFVQSPQARGYGLVRVAVA